MNEKTSEQYDAQTAEAIGAIKKNRGTPIQCRHKSSRDLGYRGWMDGEADERLYDLRIDPEYMLAKSQEQVAELQQRIAELEAELAGPPAPSRERLQEVKTVMQRLADLESENKALRNQNESLDDCVKVIGDRMARIDVALEEAEAEINALRTEANTVPLEQPEPEPWDESNRRNCIPESPEPIPEPIPEPDPLPLTPAQLGEFVANETHIKGQRTGHEYVVDSLSNSVWPGELRLIIKQVGSNSTYYPDAESIQRDYRNLDGTRIGTIPGGKSVVDMAEEILARHHCTPVGDLPKLPRKQAEALAAANLLRDDFDYSYKSVPFQKVRKDNQSTRA